MSNLKIIGLDKLGLNKNVFKQFVANDIEQKMPFLQAERLLGFLSRKDEKSKVIYNNFYSDLENYNVKIPNSNCKKCVSELINRNLIFLGKSISNTKSGNIGAFTVHNGKLSSVILDVAELNINILTGESESIDLPYYTSYFEYIRAVVMLNAAVIQKDTELHTSIIHWLSLMFLKMVSSNTTLNDKQKLFLDTLIAYFYFRFFLNQSHHQVSHNVLDNLTSKEIKNEFKFLSEKLDKYTSFKDIYKAFLDYNIFNDPPSVLLMKSLNKVTPFVFYNLTTTLDHLIALIVLSSYSFKFTSPANINNQLQNKIESSIIKYSKNVNYDLYLLDV